ncbi:MAG: hypothetical protein ACI8TX_001739 [Hyphomicrobiaceae bacterium]|jgi:hypothetical protein
MMIHTATKLLGFTASLIASMALAIPAAAQLQSDSQQDCINSLYKAGSKVGSTVAKEIGKCVQDAGKDKLGSLSAQDCLTADRKGKIGKTKVKAAGAAGNNCSAPPTIGPSSSVSINNAFGGNVVRIGEVFGNPLDTALAASTGKNDDKCQFGVAKSMEKVLKTTYKSLLRCVSSGFRDETILSDATLGDCMDALDQVKVAKLVAKGDRDVEKRCTSGDIATLFPGDCSSEAVGDFFPCVAERVSCGVCVTLVTAGGVSVDCDLIDDGLDNDSCAAGPEFPDITDDYVAGDVSYVDTVSLPALPGGVPTCCRDFGTSSRDFIENGTNNPDNALAQLVATIAGLGFDVQTFLDDAVQSGDLTLLLDHQDLVTDVLPDEFGLAALFADFDAGTTYMEAAAGTGDFIVSRGSFIGGTGTPVTVFFPGIFDVAPAGMLAGPSGFTFPLPFGPVELSLPISGVLVEGEPTVGPGISYSDGKLSGFMLIDDFFAGLNSLLDSSVCDCLGLSESIFTQDGGGNWSGSGCLVNAAALCTAPEESTCVTLGGNQVLSSPPQVCSVLPGIIEGSADLDLNEDPSRYEGFTIGLQLTAVPGSITGIEAP